MMTVSSHIIDAFGGTTAVSRMTETPLSTVHSWRKKGIPRSRMAHLRLVAEREDIAIDWETGQRIDHVASDTADADAGSSGNAQNISTAQVPA